MAHQVLLSRRTDLLGRCWVIKGLGTRDTSQHRFVFIFPGIPQRYLEYITYLWDTLLDPQIGQKNHRGYSFGTNLNSTCLGNI